jgi:hypothetical protein
MPTATRPRSVIRRSLDESAAPAVRHSVHQATSRVARNLAIGAAAVGLAGQEGDLFRKVLGWSLLLLLLMCVIVYLQSIAVLSWMVV